jgi:hypothetical protein
MQVQISASIVTLLEQSSSANPQFLSRLGSGVATLCKFSTLKLHKVEDVHLVVKLDHCS